MKTEHIKISREELDRIYEDFNDADLKKGIMPKESERIELALKQDGRIAGYASGLVEYRLFYISDLWVEEGLRRQGAGTQLLSGLEHEAAQRGCDEAYTWTAGEESLAFYSGRGYEVFVRFEDFTGVKGHHRYGLRKTL